MCGTKSLRTITVVWLDGMNTTQLLFSSFAHSLYVAASSVQNPLSLIGIPITAEDTPQYIYKPKPIITQLGSLTTIRG